MEEELAGGNSNRVVRVGDTVRREAGPWTPAVHELLATLRAAGIDRVPAPLGFDERGREVLTFLPGRTCGYPPESWVYAPTVLDDAGGLLRQVHDASRLLLGRSLTWSQPAREPVEVICHNDVAPYNLTFADGRVAGLFDFDAASPGARVWDLAYLAYRLAPLVGDVEVPELSLDDRLMRIDRLVDAYGWPLTRSEVLDTIVLRLDHLAAFTADRATTTGDPRFLEHVAVYRADRDRIAALADAQ